MAKRASKTVALAISFDEKRFGAYRAVNYGGRDCQNEVIAYHDSEPRRGVWTTVGYEAWEEMAAWCSAQSTVAA